MVWAPPKERHASSVPETGPHTGKGRVAAWFGFGEYRVLEEQLRGCVWGVGPMDLRLEMQAGESSGPRWLSLRQKMWKPREYCGENGQNFLG